MIVTKLFIPFLLLVRFLVLPSGANLEIVPQNGNMEYVSSDTNVVTQYVVSSTIWLLAHNNQAGQYFFDVEVGQIINIGEENYVVTKIKRVEVIDDVFRDIETGVIYTIYDLVDYLFSYDLILQTCIQRGSESSWGRYFVLAEARNKE